jgi:hypothetical protein
MRNALLFLVLIGCADRAAAQPPVDPAAGPPRDGIAVGLQITPALDGFVYPWLMSSVRVSVPLPGRLGIDVEAGRIAGGTTELPSSSPHAVIQVRSFYSSQLRFNRGTRKLDGSGRYFLIGLQFLTVEKFDHDGLRVVDELASNLLLGLGFDQFFTNRTRLSAELGLAAGDGFVPYLAIGVQWRPFR